MNDAPSARSSKAEWVDYAASQGLDRGEAEAMPKAELMVWISDEQGRSDDFGTEADAADTHASREPEPEPARGQPHGPVAANMKRVAPRVWVDAQGRRHRW